MTTHAATTRAYAIGILRHVALGPPLVEYLERIDATLSPFGGRFIVHGGATELLEGSHPGDVVIIEFPDRESASAWYRSTAYQAILPLRAENSASTVIISDGVGSDHVATDVLGPPSSTTVDGSNRS